jgi:hypothetical protein
MMDPFTCDEIDHPGPQIQVHELKCWPEAFEPMLMERKNFEFRKNDRDFRIGDILHLREWSPFNDYDRHLRPYSGDYTGRDMYVRVSWILESGFGLPERYCIMSTVKITPEFMHYLVYGDME